MDAGTGSAGDLDPHPRQSIAATPRSPSITTTPRTTTALGSDLRCGRITNVTRGCFTALLYRLTEEEISIAEGGAGGD